MVSPKKSQSTGELRQAQHQEVKKLLLTNQLEKAIIEFENIRLLYGPHVGLLCDLAACYYESNRFNECWDLVDNIIIEYEKAELILSNSSKQKTALMLSKFFEQKAEISQAVHWINISIEFSEDESSKKYSYCNELRILSYFGIKKDLNKKYFYIIDLCKQNSSLKIEILHSLLWAEWSLFGYQHALSRWLELQKLELNELDKRLIARNFIEISLLSNIELDNNHMKSAKKTLEDINRMDVDEAYLRLLDHKLLNNFSYFDELKLSPMMRLRILILQIKLYSNKSLSLELMKKFSFLVGSASEASQKFLLKIQPNVIASQCITLYFEEKRKVIQSDSPLMEINMTDLQCNFFKFITQSSTLDLNQAAHFIWDLNEGDESIYNRLRMIVYKINDQLQPLLGIKPFEIKKSGIIQNSNIQIKVQ